MLDRKQNRVMRTRENNLIFAMTLTWCVCAVGRVSISISFSFPFLFLFASPYLVPCVSLATSYRCFLNVSTIKSLTKQSPPLSQLFA